MLRRHLLAGAAFALAVMTHHPLLFAARVVNDSQAVQIHGNLAPQLAAAVDVGPASQDLPLDRMVLLLNLRAGAKERLEQLLADQLDPSSPRYQRWLTPEEYGQEFGISDDDVKAVVDWLQRNGLGVDEVAAGRGWITFSGTVAQVERALHTEFRELIVDRRAHRAATREPEIPSALVDLVAGFPSLGDFFAEPRHRVSGPLTSLPNGIHDLAPGDFSTIYNTAPLYATGVDGTGQTIAVVSRTDIKLADVQAFRSVFGLPANDPVFTHNGPAPGIVTDDEGEGCLDVEWSGAVAPRATINSVVTKPTATTPGELASAQYIVNANLAPVLTMSFGLCEGKMSASTLATYNSLWQQAAAQGITVFVSSGDGGAASCDQPTATVGTAPGVSGFCSTPYDVCVGGTQFMDTANPSLYWSSTNSSNLTSARSYIPEQAWNESGAATGGAGLFSTGGGPSKVYPKPSWQVAPGVPVDGLRDTPDVSLTAAAHDGYIVFQEYDPATGSFNVDNGTSAAAPSFAGIMALVVQRMGARQGNANPQFYALAQSQYSGGGPAVFHDVTTGNNTVPGVAGFSAGPGYDLATGLGSVDAAALVDNVALSSATVANFFFTPASPVVGQPVQFTDTSTGGPISWLWAFGDGGFSTSQNPTHTFTSPGTFTLTLTANYSFPEGSHSTSRSVTVLAAGSASFIFTPASPAAGQPVQFTDTSTGGPISWSWSFGDDGSSVSQNPTHTFASPGTFTVTLTVSYSSPLGSSSKSQFIQVTSAPTEGFTYVLPSSAHATGANGAFYTTDLSIANRGTTAANLTLQFLGHDRDGTAGPVQSRALATNAAVTYTDILASVFGVGATDAQNYGAILVTADSPSLKIVSQTSTPPPNGLGTFGQSVPAQGANDFVTPASPKSLIALRDDTAFRTNAFLANATTSSVTATLTLLAADGSTFGTATRTLPPLGMTQIGSVVTALGAPAGTRDAVLVVSTTTSGAQIACYASVIDNVTNDPRTILP